MCSPENLCCQLDIRLKISLTFVSVALISFVILGTFAYRTSAELIQQISVRQLDALAESKKQDLLKVHESWENQLRLIRSRTQLGINLRDHVLSGKPEALNAITRTVRNATGAVKDVNSITIFDIEGRKLASSGNVASQLFEIPDEDVKYVGSYTDKKGALKVILSSMILLDEEAVGGIEMVIDASDLFDVTRNYTGLGDTGESMLVKAEDDNMVMVLNPLRHDPGGFFRKQDLALISPDIKAALEAREDTLTENIVDYRGVQVWAVTRFLPQLKWGLVVKVDAAEEEALADILKNTLIDIALALSAFAIIGGALIGLHLARPIHELVEVVRRVRDGDLSARADTRGDDEIAYLGENLNDFVIHLEQENIKSKDD